MCREVIILPELGEIPVGSFQILRITSWSEACAGWMLSSPLMTDKTTSLSYLNRLRNTRLFPDSDE
jgi:hypothetical protein